MLVTQEFKENPSFRLWFWIALTAVFLAMFLIFSSEVLEASSGEPELIGQVDKLAAELVGTLRNPALNAMAVDVTALGSATVLSIFILVSSSLLVFKRRFAEAIHIVTAAAGAAVISWMMKSYFERARPVTLPHLVDVQGYSYPSGHSLASAAVYFTFAALLFHQFKHKNARFILVFFALALIGLIALSRIYLGVHYASDTIAGVLLGTGWAAALAAANEFLLTRRRLNGL